MQNERERPKWTPKREVDNVSGGVIIVVVGEVRIGFPSGVAGST